jgi:hypothetical protein
MAHVTGEIFDAFSRPAHELGELRGVLIEVGGGAAGGLRNVTGQLSSGSNLHVQQTFCLLLRVGRERRGGLLRLTAGLLRDVGDFRSGFARFGAHILGSAYPRR